MAHLAVKTSRIRFLTSVMVVLRRPAVLTAKLLSTIDVMSGGRVIDERGKVTDEYFQRHPVHSRLL